MTEPRTLVGPKPSFLAGNLPEYGRDQLAAMVHWSRDYGDVVPLRFGPRRAFLVRDPALIEELLVRRQREFRKSDSIKRLAPVVGQGLFSSDGEFWLRRRRLAQPAFHRDRIATYGGVMVDHAERTIEGWRHGEVRDIWDEMKALTLRVAVKTLFDSEVTREVQAIGRALNVTSAHLQTRLDSLRFFIPDWIPTPGNRRMWRAIRTIEEIIYAIIAERRRTGVDTGDLLSTLLAARDDDGRPMTDRQLRDEVMTLMVAGHETTSSTLTWSWILLSQHPEVEAALRDAADRAGGPPTVADIPALGYIEHVVYEVLRLYPPAYATSRQALRDVDIGGARIKRGDIVIASQWALQRDPRFFDAPDDFRPERWADGLAKRLPRGVYFPFGMGPRQCIGASFAMMEAVLVLARIAQSFRLRLEPGPAIEPVTKVALRPNRPVPMRIEARSEARVAA